MTNEAYKARVQVYNEQVTVYNAGLNEIRSKVTDAEALNKEGLLSNSQVKKIKAIAYNEEKAYKRNTPRPQKPAAPGDAGKRALIASVLSQMSGGF